MEKIFDLNSKPRNCNMVNVERKSSACGDTIKKGLGGSGRNWRERLSQ
jgi:hypothetical protein